MCVFASVLSVYKYTLSKRDEMWYGEIAIFSLVRQNCKREIERDPLHTHIHVSLSNTHTVFMYILLPI